MKYLILLGVFITGMTSYTRSANARGFFFAYENSEKKVVTTEVKNEKSVNIEKSGWACDLNTKEVFIKQTKQSFSSLVAKCRHGEAYFYREVSCTRDAGIFNKKVLINDVTFLIGNTKDSYLITMICNLTTNEEMADFANSGRK